MPTPRLSRQVSRTPASQVAGSSKGTFMSGVVLARALEGDEATAAASEGLSTALTVQLPGGPVQCTSSTDQPLRPGDRVTVALKADNTHVVLGLA
jgi:hypothetical protein